MNDMEQGMSENENGNEITKPEHYWANGGVEPIDLMHEAGIAEEFCVGNIMKYVLRYKMKDGERDLLKAKKYIDFLIAMSRGSKPSDAHKMAADEWQGIVLTGDSDAAYQEIRSIIHERMVAMANRSLKDMTYTDYVKMCDEANTYMSGRIITHLKAIKAFRPWEEVK